MTRRVYKYEVPIRDEVELTMPKWASLLRVHEQHGRLFVWAEIQDAEPTALRRLAVRGTGQDVDGVDGQFPPGRFTAYVGTAFMKDDLVWHVYDRGYDRDERNEGDGSGGGGGRT
jgi:hypothetical protein